MKKCASCTKDLPEAALHCVFCGAKQAAVPAVQPGLAKTAFGYSANEVLDQIKTPGAPRAPITQPYSPPRPTGGSQPPPMGNYAQATMVAPPTAPNAANAATMFVPGQPPPQQQQPYNAGAMNIPQPLAPPGGMGIHAQHLPTPQPLPVSASPYLSSRARPGAVIEPWKDSLRLVMFVWGAIALVTFATPLQIDPLVFNWDAIIHGGDGTVKLLALLLPAVGVLAIVLAAIPLQALPRGILAALLGLVGALLPIFLIGMPPWQVWVLIAGLLTLVPGLLVRNEYTDSLFARVLVTIGVLCTLAPFLIPVGSDIPLVTMFKGLLDAAGTAKILAVLPIVEIVLVVLALLAWMPGPATGGAKVFAWAIILWSTLVSYIVTMIIGGKFIDAITKTPGVVLKWAPEAVFMVLIGYGLATVFGKRLE